MNRGRGGNRGGNRGGGNRGGGGGGGGGRYVPRGRSSQSADRHSAVGAHSNESSPGNGSGSSRSGTRNSEVSAVDNVTKKFSDLSSSDYPQGSNSEPRGAKTASPNDGNPRRVQNVALGSNNDFPSLSTESAQTIDCSFMNGKLPKEVESGKSTSDGTSGKSGFENSDSQPKGCSFNICEQRVVKLKTSLLVKNKAVRNEMKRRTEGDNNIRILRPGMILLKYYLSVTDQVKLIKACRDLGRGHGGFYQPGYNDGAKLQLKMMCLGKNWDPKTCMYGDKRPIDEAKPPPIPVEFQHLVKEVIRDCHSHLESYSIVKNPRDILPSISPNICIVNFYTKTGKLGLHQDKGESQESLRKGLPVVSFSIGDSAEFLFGDQRDIDKAEKVVLESGDVLIFGGNSRHIFHGVSNIIPNTAPKALLEETDFKPGRLNLTFREY